MVCLIIYVHSTKTFASNFTETSNSSISESISTRATTSPSSSEPQSFAENNINENVSLDDAVSKAFTEPKSPVPPLPPARSKSQKINNNVSSSKIRQPPPLPPKPTVSFFFHNERE